MTDPDPLVLVEVDQGVAVLTFNRPERKNAWTFVMEEQYHQALVACGDDPEVRVIVVTGSGKSFCPGIDAAALSASASRGVQTSPHERTPMTLPRSIPKPIIAAIDGPCAGLGLVVALQCDLRFASENVKITTSFAQRGIMAEQGIAWSLPKVVGFSRAFDLLVSARIVRGPEALELGLVDRVFTSDDLMTETLAYARSIAATSSPTAMGVMKRQLYAAQTSTHEEARILSIRYWYDVLRDHPDFREGVESYLERRAPAFAPWDPSTTDEPAPLPES